MNLIIVQSRNGSNRLPFKSSLSIAGYATLIHVISRVKKVLKKNINLVVATSTNIEDDVINDLCLINDIDCFRGHPTNVLSRFQELSNIYKPKNIIRITGDCPLIDTRIIQKLIDFFEKNCELDYASNTIERTYPHGFDLEIFRSNTLTNEISYSDYDYEHVTPFIYTSGKFKIDSLLDKVNNSRYRVTLDTKYDYFFINKLVNKIISNSERKDSALDNFSSSEIAYLIENNDQLKKMHLLAKEYSK